MKNLKLLFYFLFMGSVVTFTTSCEEDEPLPTYDDVSVSTPALLQVDNGATGQSVTFNVSVDSDLNATYSATGTGVTITNPTGDVTGSSVTINFDAGMTEGAASITLVVTDSQNQRDEATAVINIGDAPIPVTALRVEENITSDQTWTSNVVYTLGGRIAVESGATLTIEAGTIIKGAAGTGANATALLVARGAKIIAEGTADAPIIFTSVADEISPADIAAGNFASPNLDPDINGLWGGLIVLGNAPVSAPADKLSIEGIPTSDVNGAYGGTDAEDNSGILKYISIRHGGSNIGEGNEINGLTLGGVGSGTVVDHIEVVANQDDGIEWFGGTVDATNLVVWNAGDDGLDTDQAWSGTATNYIVVTPAGNCFELDGPEEPGTLSAGHTFVNGTVVASINSDNQAGSITDTDAGEKASIVTIRNLWVTSVQPGQLVDTDGLGTVKYENVELDVEDNVTNYIKGGMAIDGVSAGNGANVKADASVFGWTWAGQSGGLDKL